MKLLDLKYLLILAILIPALIACSDEEKESRCMQVKASAYNSLPYQTRPGSSGKITAWGDTLADSIPSIAISRDLLDSGITYGTMVSIEGFEERFVVNDKMNSRYKKRIDIHMGRDVKAAKEWGVQKVSICFEPEVPVDESAYKVN